MFHNIFQKLVRKSKNKQKIKPRIIADIHEKDSMILAELKSNEDVELEITNLKIGDYLIGNTIIERKTTSDFISSMINRRLIEQLNQMQQYNQRLLIIEGQISSIFEKDNNLHPNSIRGFILSIISNYNTNIIFTTNYQDTANYLITLAKQQLKPKTLFSLHSRIPKTKQEQKQYILEAFPNIGPKKAELLIKKFKTLSNVFNATEEELKEVLKNQSKSFKDILNY
ncbi:MAG: ERCC4 domain-containing protein [Nanoarchaeota archaeon]